MLVAFVLFASVSACADEVRYILPEGFYYNEDGYIVTSSGNVYESWWDEGLSSVRTWFDHYNDKEYMDKYMRVDEFGNPIRMGDGRADILLLCGAAVIAVSGAAFAHRKAKHVQ
ncbi:MAG: hypothetical protein E7335_01535 [Clostridiales bacterium]|nr:hypothetical protein [Clostridiales bacterium]